MRYYKRCFFCGRHTLEKNFTDMLHEVVSGNLNKYTKMTYNERMNKLMVEWGLTRLKQLCQFCNEPLLTQIFNVDEAHELAYKTYDEFVKFMDGVDLPKEIIIKIVHEDEDEDLKGHHGVCSYDEELGKFVVKIDIAQVIFKSTFKSILYHEFTHILDGFDVSTGAKKESRNVETMTGEKGHWYTEYHASEIQLMQSLGFESINDNKKIRSSKIIINNNKCISIIDHLFNLMNCYKDTIIENCKKKVTFETLVPIVRNIMYFRGSFNFCKKYFDEKSIMLLPDGNELENTVRERFCKGKDAINALLNVLNKALDKALDHKNMKTEDVYGILIDDLMQVILTTILFQHSDEYKDIKEKSNEYARYKIEEFLQVLEGKIAYGDPILQ